MERYSSSTQSDADRFGFTQPEDGFKIHVSSTGKATQVPLPPLTAVKGNINTQSLAKALDSIWMKDYRHFCECLLHALRDDPYLVQKKHHAEINHPHCHPHFANSRPDARNSTTFSDHNVHISLFLTSEDKEKGNYNLLPFGGRYYQLPQCPITFALIDPQESDFLGKVHGQIISKSGLSVIKITQLEDFGGKALSWDKIPVGSNMVATLNLEGNLPISNSGSYDEEELPGEENLPAVIRDQPQINYFMGPSNIEIKVDVFAVPPPNFRIEQTNFNQDLLIKILGNDKAILGYVQAHLHPDGQVELGQLVPLQEGQSINWEIMNVRSLFFVLELPHVGKEEALSPLSE